MSYEVEYKGYKIRPHLNVPQAYIIVYPGRGGKCPKILEGAFTSHNVARQAIDLYLDSKEA